MSLYQVPCSMWGAGYSGDQAKKEEYRVRRRGPAQEDQGTGVTDRSDRAVTWQNTGSEHRSTPVWGQVRAVLGDLCVWRVVTN